jgi:carbon storage regulator
MLFVTRRTGDVVRIGNDVAISVVEIRAGQVKLGIRAPRQTSVYREELALRIESEDANAVPPGDSPNGEKS